MRSDVEIRDDVIAEIRWDPQLITVASLVNVEVKNEVVTLSGAVDHYHQRVAAEKAAQRIAGVKVVAVDIDVKSEEAPDEPTDTQIAEAIRNALTWHSAVNEDLINITVDGGWVHLDGVVDHEYERKAAEDSIKNLRGVKGLVNKVKIKVDEVRPEEIRKRINQAFHRHATVNSSNVTVKVSGNKVKLVGKVSSWVERKDAEDVAWAMPRVTEVDNQLEIDTNVYVGE